MDGYTVGLLATKSRQAVLDHPVRLVCCMGKNRLLGEFAYQVECFLNRPIFMNETVQCANHLNS